MRHIFLDTETTGLKTSDGHRIIEIGCVEMVDRRLTGNIYHQYINPQRAVDKGAFNVHGISNDMLADKPVFVDVCVAFLEFVRDAELIIHNAPFDVGFLDYEMRLNKIKPGKINKYCQIIDTLVMARELHPGQKNNLDALCKRYYVDNSHREYHGALLDAQILAQVYLMMTGGQGSLFAEDEGMLTQQTASTILPASDSQQPTTIILQPTDEELKDHQAYVEFLQSTTEKEIPWD